MYKFIIYDSCTKTKIYDSNKLFSTTREAATEGDAVIDAIETINNILCTLKIEEV